MCQKSKVMLLLSALGFAFVPSFGRADTFPMEGWGSDFLAYLSTNFVNVTHANVPEGMLQRLHNEDGSPLPMIGGEDLLFKLTHEDGSYEHIHVFTNTLGKTFGLQTGYVVKDAQVLVVGGGGAGAAGYGYYGGGAGGGAGGFVNKLGVTLRSGNYQVTAGAGGAGAGASRGGSGKASSIIGPYVSYEALGGGGGGFESAGLDGASGGGGGCMKYGAVTVIVGGKGTDGQGFDGGSGWNEWGGGAGAGGGAAAPGGSASKTNGGKGGDGLACFILGFEQYFAGGGGGSAMNGGGGGAGGKGGGASGENGGLSHRGWAGNSGTNGLGGGGAGSTGDSAGSSRPAGGRGGDGIVIVRYKGDPKPTGLILRVQ